MKHIICMDDELPSEVAAANWVVTSFSDVKRLGQENPVEPDFPVATDVAVIMYTSGSTGLPKVSLILVCSDYVEEKHC